VSLLLLFDLDGTLLHGDDVECREAFRAAVADVYGVTVGEDVLTHHGATAIGALRISLPVDPGDPQRWCTSFCEHYRLLLGERAPSLEPAPGAAETLAGLAREHRLALLTGNPRAMARVRVDRLGLGGFFADGQGAFGDEREERAELVALARGRAGDWPRERTVVVGDTPRDVDAAHGAGVRCVAVAAGPYDRDALAAAGADAVVDTLAELPALLAALTH
jgi:phosphoglycolate phosphatase-like HAD superfamily hydrolase